MPTSSLFVAPDILAMVEGTGAQRVLDVGPGYGKYGVLLREYAHVERVDAIEKWEPYIGAFGLRGIYTMVYQGDACDLPAEMLAWYHCVLLGDVIEHMEKDAATAFLDRIPGWVVICTPVDFFPQPHEVPTEHHVSHWTSSEFAGRPDADQVMERAGGIIARLRPKDVAGITWPNDQEVTWPT